jgi:hypothetical protein
MVLGAFATEAAAHIGGKGDFSCRASAFRVFVGNPFVFSEPQVANPPGVPCQNDADLGATASVPGVASATALDARTFSNPGGVPGGQANASDATAVVTVAGQTIRAGVLQSQANAFCSTRTGTPILTGSSSVAQLSINNSPPVNVSGQQTINVGPVTVYLNRKIVSGGVITQRALEVNSPAIGPLGPTNVVFAEAVADVQRCEPVAAP